jgi:hypothetical protein
MEVSCMAFRTTLANVNQKRTCASLYVNAAAPQSYTLDPGYSGGDIYPGMVAMMHDDGEVTLHTGADHLVPLGLFANFCAPTLGVDEVTTDPNRQIGVWVGGADAQFSVLAPAFDTTKSWVVGHDGVDVYLVAGSGTHNLGMLCPAGHDDTANHTVEADAVPVARLISVVSTTEIIIAPVDSASFPH